MPPKPNIPKSKPRKLREVLVRRALALPAGAAGWWPANPTDEDLAALSILMGIADADFSSDFAKREQLAKNATGRSLTPATHLHGLVYAEKNRCRRLRPKRPGK